MADFDLFLDLDDWPRSSLQAVIFTAYVASALFLPTFVIKNLLKSYWALARSPRSPNNGITLNHSQLQFITFLTILSFSVLSYNLLSFLLSSYQLFAWNWFLTAPRTLLGKDGFLLGLTKVGERPVLIWDWLTCSTLFKDFAMEISKYPGRYWWTFQTLAHTLDVGMWMARRYVTISHL